VGKITFENTQRLETKQEPCHRAKRLRKDESLFDSYHRDTTTRFTKLVKFSHENLENIQRQKAIEVEESMKCQEKLIQEKQTHIDILILENASVKKKLWKQEDSNKYQDFENMALAHDVSRLRKRLECEIHLLLEKLNEDNKNDIDNLKSEAKIVKEKLLKQENLIENEKLESIELKHEVSLLKEIFESKIVSLVDNFKEEKQTQIDNLKLENSLMKDKLLKQRQLIKSQDFENTELKHEVSLLKKRLESKIELDEKLKDEGTAEKENFNLHGTFVTTTSNEIIVSDDSDEARSFDSNETVKPVFENIETLSLKKSFQNHKSYIHALSHFEKLGTKYIISGSWDKSVKIWDLSDYENATVTMTLPTSANVYSTTIFEHDSSLLIASAGCDPNEIQVRNLENNSLYCTLTGHSNCIHVLVNYEINGKTFLVSGSVDKTIKLWDIVSKECVHTFIGHSGSVFSLDVFEKDGKKLLVSGSYDKTIKLWDLDCKSLVITFIGHSSWVFSVKVFFKGNQPYLASGSRDQTIKIWNLNNYQLENTLTGHTHTIMTLALITTENRLYLASGSVDKTIKLWDLENYSLRKTLSVPSITYSLTSYCTSAPCLISGHRDGSMMIWTEQE